jgi:hypothetical protein
MKLILPQLKQWAFFDSNCKELYKRADLRRLFFNDLLGQPFRIVNADDTEIGFAMYFDVLYTLAEAFGVAQPPLCTTHVET